MKDNGRRHAPAATSQITDAAENSNAHRLTALQAVIGETGDALALVDKLNGRARAVAIDIARRQLARLMRRHRCELEEHGLWPEEPASISIEFSRGFARVKTRGSAAEVRELRRWLAGNAAARSDFAECVNVLRPEQ